MNDTQDLSINRTYSMTVAQVVKLTALSEQTGYNQSELVRIAVDHIASHPEVIPARPSSNAAPTCGD